MSCSVERATINWAPVLLTFYDELINESVVSSNSALGRDILLQRSIANTDTIRALRVLMVKSNACFAQAYKYVPFGPVDEVMPYLIRRAQENSDLMGGVGHEMAMLRRELTRRLLSENPISRYMARSRGQA